MPVMRAVFTKKRRKSAEGAEKTQFGANDNYREVLGAEKREERKGKFSNTGKSDAQKRKDRKKKAERKKNERKKKTRRPKTLFQRFCRCCEKSSKIGDKPDLQRQKSATQIERLVRGFNARRKLRKVIEEKRARAANVDIEDGTVFDIEEFETVKKERDDIKKERDDLRNQVVLLKKQLHKLVTDE